MDNNNWGAAQAQIQIPSQVIGGEAAASGGMEGGDWRNQLQSDARQRIVNKIMVTLKRHLPFSGEHGLQELKKIAVRFEEKIYAAAKSQSDYLRKISLKMLTMETKSQNPMANSLQSNAASNSENPQDPVVGQHQQQQKQTQQLYIMHQQQLGPQTNLSGFQQQQMVGIQAKQQQQQQMQQNMANMLPNQAQQPMQQQANNMQQRIQTSVPLLQQQTTIDQQKHLLPLQQVMPEVPLSCEGYTSTLIISSLLKNMNAKDEEIQRLRRTNTFLVIVICCLCFWTATIMLFLDV